MGEYQNYIRNLNANPLRTRTGGRRQCVVTKMLCIFWVVRVLLITGVEISIFSCHMEGRLSYLYAESV
jgi:hypothetical protein